MAVLPGHEGPLGVLSEALDTYTERGLTYDGTDGGVLDNMDAIARLASMLIGRPISAREIALVMVAVKLRRIGVKADHRDSYVDAVNYLAFAGALIDTAPKERPANAYHDVRVPAADRRAEGENGASAAGG